MKKEITKHSSYDKFTEYGHEISVSSAGIYVDGKQVQLAIHEMRELATILQEYAQFACSKNK